MSKGKDRKAAKEQGPFRDGHRGPPPGMVYIKCVYPPCKNQVAVPAPPEGNAVGSVAHMQKIGAIPLCELHGEMLQFYIWCQVNIKLQPQQTPHGIILPGHKQFEAKAPGGI